jgi:hypothetical protein
MHQYHAHINVYKKLLFILVGKAKDSQIKLVVVVDDAIDIFAFYFK